MIARRYRLIEPAPDRGIGPVWRASDPQRRGRDVAVTQVPATSAVLEGASSPRARGEHPDVLVALEVGAHADGGYVVTEWRDGPSLDRWLDRFAHRRPPTRTAWRCFAKLCSLVEDIHRGREGDRVHGWLSPRSLIVTDPTPDVADGVAVMDLGLARLGVRPSWRRDDDVEWTAWLAPEQTASDGLPSPAADVFALAVVACELLTGHPLAVPHARVAWWQLAREGDRAVLARLRQLRPELMGAPVDLVAQALCADPSRRFPDAGVFRKALRQAGVKTAVERAGTAVIRLPHAADLAPDEPAPRPSPRSPVAQAPAWEHDAPVTVPEEVTRLAESAFHDAFAPDDTPATEVEVIRPAGSRDLFAVEHTLTATPARREVEAEFEAVTTPLVRTEALPVIAPVSFPPTALASHSQTRPMEPRAPTLPPRAPTPAGPSQRWIIAVALVLALSVAALVYALAR